MKNFFYLLPLLLIGATVSVDGNIALSSGEFSMIGEKLVNLGSSFLNIIIGYLPYILVFSVIVGLGMFLINKITGK